MESLIMCESRENKKKRELFFFLKITLNGKKSHLTYSPVRPIHVPYTARDVMGFKSQWHLCRLTYAARMDLLNILV